MRVQLALNVRDIDEAVAYYGKLFGAEPHKRRPGYANFEIAEPPLKLVLFEDPDADERLNHLGVEVFDGTLVDRAERRIGRRRHPRRGGAGHRLLPRAPEEGVVARSAEPSVGVVPHHRRRAGKAGGGVLRLTGRPYSQRK